MSFETALDRAFKKPDTSWWDKQTKPAREIKPGDLLSVRIPHAWMREVESIRFDVDVFDSHPIVEVTFRYDDREGDSRMIALGADQMVRTD